MTSDRTSSGFSVIQGPTLGSGPVSISLLLGEDAYAGNVQCTISVNGVQVGGVQQVSAIQEKRTAEAFTLQGNWTGTPTVSVNFLNDDWNGSTGNGNDRNLYIDGLSLNGSVVSNLIHTALWNGPIYASTVPVMRATDFVGSIGVTTHLLYADTSYKNESLVLSGLAYLGINHVRDGGGMIDPNAVLPFEKAMAAGIKFNFTSSTDGGVATEIARLRTLVAAKPGGIISVEGINEATASFTYAGLNGQAAALKFQTDLYTAMKADPVLSSIPVLNYTLLSQDPADYLRYGNVSATADYGNVHLYPYGGATTVTSTLLPRELEGTPNTRGFALTETGYDTLSNGATVSAKYLLDAVLDAAQAGASATYIYELMDEFPDPGNTTAENHFGLFDVNGTAKPAAVGFHNLTSILADPGATASTFTPGALDYALTNLPNDGRSLLLSKSDGSFDLAIWAEPLIGPNSPPAPMQTVTVTLGKAAASVNVFDTLSGTTPVATYTNTSSVTIGVVDHPVILSIVPMVAATPLSSTGDESGLVVTVAEDAWAGDAQFTVTIDGQRAGGIYTATASHAAGQSQAITVASTLAGGTHQVGISFINDAYGGSPTTDRNLYVMGASYNGTAVAGAAQPLFGNSTDRFAVDVTAPASSSVVAPPPSGSGLVVNVAEDAYLGDAQFIVTIDGQQVGGTYTATASHAAGQSQAISVATTLSAGSHRVGVSFINDAYGGPGLDRNLYLTSASYDGNVIAGASASMFGNTTSTFVATSGTPVLSTAVIGVAEDAYQGDAQFTIAIDGQQYGGVRTATMSHAAGQEQQVTITGIAEAYTAHDIAVTFLNDAYGGSASTDRNLFVTSISFDGQPVAGGSAALFGNGTQHFTALAPSHYAG